MINETTMQQELERMGAAAVRASRKLAVMSADAKADCLRRMADALIADTAAIIAANAADMERARSNGLSDAMLDRLRLDDARVAGMADGLRQVAGQSDPVGRVLSHTVRPNGLAIDKVTVPLGVVAIIYESRPNVTSDAAGICLKAGNAVILRGGSEAFDSNRTIAASLNRAAMACGIPDGAVQLIPCPNAALQVLRREGTIAC